MKRIKWFPLFCLFCALVVALAGCRARLEPPAAPLPALIPQPQRVTVGAGHFPLAPGVLFLSAGVEAGKAERREANRLLGDLQGWLRTLGWRDPGSPALEPGGRQTTILLTLEPAERQRLGEEGYILRVTGSAVVLSAARPAGLFYGVQTLRQLILGGLDAPRHGPRWPLALPCLEIVDRPRFAWRGFMLDCCRHFFPKEFIKKCLDEMALFKLNRFHWHLTDDQAWRIEIKKYPQLTEKAKGDGFYSQEDVREILAYAAERFITVVPEIEMPGHATAALTACPGLSCTGGPFASMPQWGVFADVYCAGNEDTFTFLYDVLDEVAGLFPGPWVHVGGDECPKERWKACPKCQSRRQAEGLKDEAELQSWFVRRIESHLKPLGKRLIGWDEILEGGLAPDATVMSWRGTDGGVAAARQGHDVVMAPTSSVYLDYYQGDPRCEPPAIGGFLPLRTVYAFEPCPAELNAEEAAHVLGGQGNLWSEYIATPAHASYMMWPRLCALAEAVWSAPGARDWDSFLRRLGGLRPGLRSLGMTISETAWQPVISATALPASKAWRIEMTSEVPGAAIRYTVKGARPGHRSRLYQGPFTRGRRGSVRAALFRGREPLGPVVELDLAKNLATFAPARISASGNLRPETGSEALLVDGLHGSPKNDDGAWLGVEGGDLEVTFELGGGTVVRRVTAGFLENPAAWIFAPLSFRVEVSPDGAAWEQAATLDWPASADLSVLGRRVADLRFAPRRARFVRLTARGIGLCPAGHAGAGGKAWLFIDEVAVE